MDIRNIHVVVGRGDVPATVSLAAEAERLGFGGVWVPEAASGPEAFTTLAATALRTNRVELGTGIRISTAGTRNMRPATGRRCPQRAVDL
jgi:alkanesulfonate monooxygenase SsuD/methylene tetrahydromethanopterin reductase-like flavin-dependent oxidoreductase (luciferase family)